MYLRTCFLCRPPPPAGGTDRQPRHQAQPLTPSYSPHLFIPFPWGKARRKAFTEKEWLCSTVVRATVRDRSSGSLSRRGLSLALCPRTYCSFETTFPCPRVRFVCNPCGVEETGKDFGTLNREVVVTGRLSHRGSQRHGLESHPLALCQGVCLLAQGPGSQKGWVLLHGAHWAESSPS